MLSFKTISILTALGCLSVASLSGATVGNITACYACGQFAGQNNTDWVAFSFTNTTGTDITSGVFKVGIGGDNASADSFQVGTIPANSTVFVVPGISDDGNPGHTFFEFLNAGRDTSDGGPSSDSVPFEFTGLLGSTPVDSGVFTPGDSAGPSVDNTVPHANFLGGPNGNDPCNVCFGPQVVADIHTVETSGVPEPGSLLLLAAGLGIVLVRRRFLA